MNKINGIKVRDTMSNDMVMTLAVANRKNVQYTLCSLTNLHATKPHTKKPTHNKHKSVQPFVLNTTSNAQFWHINANHTTKVNITNALQRCT